MIVAFEVLRLLYNYLSCQGTTATLASTPPANTQRRSGALRASNSVTSDVPLTKGSHYVRSNENEKDHQASLIFDIFRPH